MNAQKISTFLRKTGAVASLLAASAAVTGSLAPSASAAILLPPQRETEIDVGLGCVSGLDADCIDKAEFGVELPLISDIVSLIDSTSGTRSRLFIDDLTTANSFSGAPGTVLFTAGDEGTTPEGFWFRPSETRNGGSVGEESGRLEVGTYTFTFKNPLSKLLIRYFDTEVANFTRVLDTDGTLLVDDGPFTGPNPVPSGPNGNVQYQTWTNVSTITLKLGQDFAQGTGDGVDFQFEATESVPEPAALAGLGLVAGAMAVSRRRRATKTS